MFEQYPIAAPPVVDVSLLSPVTRHAANATLLDQQSRYNNNVHRRQGRSRSGGGGGGRWHTRRGFSSSAARDAPAPALGMGPSVAPEQARVASLNDGGAYVFVNTGGRAHDSSDLNERYARLMRRRAQAETRALAERQALRAAVADENGDGGGKGGERRPYFEGYARAAAQQHAISNANANAIAIANGNVNARIDSAYGGGHVSTLQYDSQFQFSNHAARRANRGGFNRSVAAVAASATTLLVLSIITCLAFFSLLLLSNTNCDSFVLFSYSTKRAPVVNDRHAPHRRRSCLSLLALLFFSLLLPSNTHLYFVVSHSTRRALVIDDRHAPHRRRSGVVSGGPSCCCKGCARDCAAARQRRKWKQQWQQEQQQPSQ
jgi:hypothetical protein